MLAADYFSNPTTYVYIVVLVVAVALLIVIRIVRMMGRAARRLRPTTIHPNLQKYAEPTETERAERAQHAAKIITTSSRAEIAGYTVVQQIEAVFVDGYRETSAAIEGLKAVAGLKGANALINLTQQRTAGGRCQASADAVIVRPADKT